MSIELRHIKYALAAAEFRSFRRAAAALSVQQSTVSRQVRELEDAIGVSIFFRSSGGIKLTPAGRSFLTRAKYGVDEILFATNDALATGRGQLGTVRIGILSSLASGFLPQLLKAFAEAHPGIVVSLVDGRADSHIAAVQRQRLDVAFVAGEPELLDCEATLLWAERVFVALSEGHPLTLLSELNWHDMQGHNFIVGEAGPSREMYELLVHRLGKLSHHPAVEVHNMGRDNLLPMVALGTALMLISESTTAVRFPGIVYRPVAEETFPFSAIWSPENDNPAFRRLLSLARSMRIFEAERRQVDASTPGGGLS